MRPAASLFIIAYIGLLMAMFLLPAYSSPGYSILGNSLNELGAQNTPNSWVMNSIFMGLALSVAILGSIKLKRFWKPLYVLYFFCLGLIFTAIFQHAPIHSSSFLQTEHIVHSIFSMLVGTAFSVYCIAVAFILPDTVPRASAVAMLALAVSLSLLMLEFPAYRGIFQRILFIVSFGWLFYSLVTFRFQKTINFNQR